MHRPAANNQLFLVGRPEKVPRRGVNEMKVRDTAASYRELFKRKQKQKNRERMKTSCGTDSNFGLNDVPLQKRMGCGRNEYFPAVKWLVVDRKRRSAWITRGKLIGCLWDTNARLRCEHHFMRGSRKRAWFAGSSHGWSIVDEMNFAVVRRVLRDARLTSCAQNTVKVKLGKDWP